MTARATLFGLCRLPIKCWRCRWRALRLTLAGALLLTLLIDNPSRLARLQYAALPDYDYLAESHRLTDAGQFGEALVVIDGPNSPRGLLGKPAPISILRVLER